LSSPGLSRHNQLAVEEARPALQLQASSERAAPPASPALSRSSATAPKKSIKSASLIGILVGECASECRPRNYHAADMHMHRFLVQRQAHQCHHISVKHSSWNRPVLSPSACLLPVVNRPYEPYEQLIMLNAGALVGFIALVTIMACGVVHLCIRITGEGRAPASTAGALQFCDPAGHCGSAICTLLLTA